MAVECRYPKPKILLIDVPSSWAEQFASAGYSVKVGTFGQPYKVKKSGGLHAVLNGTAKLPNHEEQEIIFVNIPQETPYAQAPEESGDGVDTIWQAATSGEIDPRPFVMSMVANAFNKIYDHGGIFVIFLSRAEQVTYLNGKSIFGQVAPTETFKVDNRSFLAELDSLDFQNESGEEIQFSSEYRISRIVNTAKEGARYHCSFDTSWRKDWTVLARNKFGRPVAGVLHAQDKGFVVLLPQMPCLAPALVTLLQEGLAPLAPSLFPFAERGAWLHDAEYELPELVALQHDIETIRATAEREVSEKQAHMAQLRQEHADYYQLLSGTGDELASAVLRTLRTLGFERVIDVDAETDPNARREDIQILDRSPALVVDVKGVQGKPEDAECQQAEKHALIRAREWKRTDVQALTIINSERHIPPHARTREPFRAELVENAVHMSSGLMTTMDLAILWRNTRRFNWPKEALLDVFYRCGRIYPIPSHYTLAGEVVKRWKHSVGVIPSCELSLGARIAFYSPSSLDYIEMEVTSLRVDNVDVQTAPRGSNCGIRIPDACAVKEGMSAFLVAPLCAT